MIEGKNIPELRFPGFTEEWEEKKLGDMSYDSGYGMNVASKEYDGKNKYIRITDINDSTNNYINENFVSPSGKLDDRYLLEVGDILFARTGASVGKTYFYKKSDGHVYYAGFLIRFRISKEYNYKFIFYNTLTDNYNQWVKVMSMRSGQPGINAKEYSTLPINVPSLPEQEKLGSFFYTLDKKLALQKKRIEEVKTYKKGMMQRIFSQEIRFKDENGQDYPDWEEKKLGDVFEESTLKLKDIEEPERYSELLSVTLYKGIKRQIELGDSDTSSIYKSNYKIVNKNYIVYNSMRMWQGASGISHYDGIVSSAYVVLRPKKAVRSDFMARYFKDLKLIHKFYERSQGMTSDTLTLRYNLFKDIFLTIPSLPEQEKIASFLSAIDKKIELEEERLEAYEEFKKGLMQRMFV